MLEEIIYVRLLDEGVDVFRPVPAERIGEFVYKLNGYDFHDPDDEIWEFLPGTTVVIEERILSGERSLVAVKAA